MTGNLTGNLSTIVKVLVMTIAPAIGVDEATGNTIATIIIAVIGFLLSFIDAYYPNTFKFLKNNNEFVEDGIDEPR